MIPIYVPDLSGNEKKYVQECLDTNWISSKGRFNELLESHFSKYTGIPYVTTVSNGTCALNLALACLNIPRDSEVLVPSLAYVAPASAVVRNGSIPVFVDVDPFTLQIDPIDLRRKITSKSSCIIGVHTYGYPYDAQSVSEIARDYDLFHIEDCAEAIGTSTLCGKHVGLLSDISTFSLYANKTITAGEGGFVCTQSKFFDSKLKSLKSHATISPASYDHDDYGFNFRMTNICAAIALAQLENIDQKLLRKKQIARIYNSEVKLNSAKMFDPNPDLDLHSYWMNTLLTDNTNLATQLRSHLQDNAIETRPIFSPIHTMKPYNQFSSMPLPVTERISGCGLNLPSHPSLTDGNLEYIISTINSFAS